MSGILSAFIGRVAGVVTDAYFNLVTLLLPGNGTNGAQNNTFLDSSSNNFTITRNGNTTQGTFTPFSQTGWANYFSGTSDYLTNAGSANLALGAGDFTIEAWVYPTFTSNTYGLQVAGTYNGVNNGWGLLINRSSAGVAFAFNNSLIFNTSSLLLPNAWYHVALVRSGSGTNNTTIYVNGVSSAQTTFTNNDTLSTTFYLASQGTGQLFQGYISNLRFVKGTAVYTSAFTPPTAPLTAITNTQLLTCQSNRFIDNSSNAFAFTVNGTPSVQAFSPFAPTAAYDAAVVGGSGYFDGSGDYLSIASNSAFGFGTGDFTVELWAYPTTFVNYSQWVSTRVADDASYWGVDSNSSGVFYIFTNGTVVSSSAQPKNAWIHIAAVRSSGTVKFYINGVSAGSASLTNNFLNANGLGIGAAANGAQSMYGYISNVRLIKGQALTTGDFTPPTAPVTTSAVGWTGTNVASSITGSVAVLANFTNAGITDATAKNDLETVGNAQISTTQSKFGGSSMYFDGTGDWLLFPHNVDQFLSTGNFTVEMWVYRNASGTYGLVGKGTGTTGWLVSLNSSNQVVFTFASSTITSTGTVSATTWTHIAVVREGTGTNQTKIYINGTNDGTGTVSTDFNQTNSMYVGADRTGGSAFNGYIDDLRITRIARYTANFTAPTTAFPLQ